MTSTDRNTILTEDGLGNYRAPARRAHRRL